MLRKCGCFKHLFDFSFFISHLFLVSERYMIENLTMSPLLLPFSFSR